MRQVSREMLQITATRGGTVKNVEHMNGNRTWEKLPAYLKELGEQTRWREAAEVLAELTNQGWHITNGTSTGKDEFRFELAQNGQEQPVEVLKLIVIEENITDVQHVPPTADTIESLRGRAYLTSYFQLNQAGWEIVNQGTQASREYDPEARKGLATYVYLTRPLNTTR